MEDIARSHPFQGYLMLIRYLYVNENLNFFHKGKKKEEEITTRLMDSNLVDQKVIRNSCRWVHPRKRNRKGRSLVAAFINTGFTLKIRNLNILTRKAKHV